MFNNSKLLLRKLNTNFEKAKLLYEEFRFYNLGSIALNRLTPKKGYHVESDIAYGDTPRHYFDLYRTNQPRQNRPVIVFVHGGAWSSGDKKDYKFIGEAFANEGFDVVVMNYQLAPQHIFPVYVNDLVLLLNYLKRSEKDLDVRLQEIVLMGHSAGAFNIMSALYSPQAYELSCKSQIKALIGLAGPYHFDYKDDPICADAFNQQVPYQDVMPYYFVENSTLIKHYLFVAENDNIVHLSNATDFNEKLKASGNHSEIILVPKTGHITIVGSVSSLFNRFYQTKQLIMKSLGEALN